MAQEFINAGLGLVVSGGGWWLSNMWREHRELEKKVSAIETLVAGQYVKRDELTAALNKLEGSLDRNFRLIFDKLDSKADK